MLDVFIIGGGLAGLNAARKLVKDPSLSIGLADLKRPEKNNPARFTFTDIIQPYGLSDCVINSYNSFGILTYHGAEVVHSYDEKVFIAFEYNKACKKLLDHNLTFRNFYKYDERVLHIKQQNQFVEVILSSGKQIQAKILIDASGTSHLSLKYLKIPQPRLYSHSFGQSFIHCTNKNTSTAYFVGASVDFGSGGGWYYPTGETDASFGMALVTENKQFPAKELRDKYFTAKTSIEPIRSFLKNAQPVKYEVGTIPIQYIAKLVYERILIVGDAAGQATPWMCMGVEPALLNSDMVANAILKAKEGNDFCLERLNDYQEEWDTANKETYRAIENQSTKIWFMNEAVWDFIIEKDLKNLTSMQFYQRIKSNRFLMPKHKALFKWAQFRLLHLFDYKKYKHHKLNL